MKFAPVLFFWVSASTFAASNFWNDFKVEDQVILTQNLLLDGARGGTIHVPAGEKYSLEAIQPLEGLSVVDLIFAAKRCRYPQLEGALTMVLPVENPRTSKAEVGVYFNRGCEIEVLVEAKDFGRSSFFLK